MRKTLIVMVKEPRPGRVKTRLGKGIGMVGAAWWYRHQVARLVRRLEDPRWRLVLAVAPDQVAMTSRVWPAHLVRVPQGAGDLGDRMGRLLRGFGRGRVCLIGSDIPGILPRHIAEAFAALGSHDAVVGPAVDGGYWLVGLAGRGAPRALFGNVRWSSPHALEDTLRSMKGLRVAQATTLRDVDEVGDL